MGRSHKPVEPESHWRGKFLLIFLGNSTPTPARSENGNLITFYHDRFYCITISFSYREAAAASYILGDTSWLICCFIFLGWKFFREQQRNDAISCLLLACFVYNTSFLVFFLRLRSFKASFSLTYGEGLLDMACKGFLFPCTLTWSGKRRHF